MVKKSLKKPILEEKVIDLENKWKRALADYANLEKRIAKEKEDFVNFSKSCLVVKMIGVLDDLERCQKHLKDEGLNLTVSRLKEVLKSEEVEEIEALGKNFDPKLMEAVEVVAGQKNKILEVILKGYLLNKKVIRPVKVKVGQGK